MFGHLKFESAITQQARRYSSRLLNRSVQRLPWRVRRHAASSLARRARLPFAGSRPRKSRRIFIWRSGLSVASMPRRSCARPLEAVPGTMARAAYAPLSRAPLCSVRSRSGPVQHRGGLPRTCGSDVVHPAAPAGQGDI